MIRIEQIEMDPILELIFNTTNITNILDDISSNINRIEVLESKVSDLDSFRDNIQDDITLNAEHISLNTGNINDLILNVANNTDILDSLSDVLTDINNQESSIDNNIYRITALEGLANQNRSRLISNENNTSGNLNGIQNNNSHIGTLSNLVTNNKINLVNAINEVHNNYDSHKNISTIHIPLETIKDKLSSEFIVAGDMITKSYNNTSNELTLSVNLSNTDVLNMIKNADGPNSGLNADFIDNINGSQLLRNDVDGTLNGNLNITKGHQISLLDRHNKPFVIKEDISENGLMIKSLDILSTGDALLTVRTQDNYPALMIEKNGAIKTSNSEMYTSVTSNGINGNKVWHEGNDGENSGLDAGKVCGLTFHTGTTEPTSTQKLTLNGEFSATKIYNPIFKDLAEFMDVCDDKSRTDFNPGDILVWNEETNGLTTTNNFDDSRTVGVYSDTYGFSLGGIKEDNSKIPVGISGRVWVNVDTHIENGDFLTTSTRYGYAISVDKSKSLWSKIKDIFKYKQYHLKAMESFNPTDGKLDDRIMCLIV